jgi:uncharacterized protein (TIGR02466 family)
MTIQQSKHKSSQIDFGFINNFIAEGKYREALTALDTLTQTHPDDANLYLIGGNCYGAMGHFEQAILCYQEAIKIKPDFANAHSNLGVYLQERNDIDEAILSYKRAIKLKPDYADAHSNLGVCLYNIGKFDEALLWCKKAIKLKPDSGLAHNVLGSVLRSLGQSDKAILSYKRAIKLKPDYTDAHHNLHGILIELGRVNEANEVAARARGGNKDYEQGLLLLEKKHFTEAIKFFEKAQVFQWQEKVLECHYKSNEFNEFNEKLPDALNNKKHHSVKIASITAHYAQNFKIKDPYNFCPSPLNFICHEQVPELMENNQQLIKELINDINTADIGQRKQSRLTSGIQSSGNLFKRQEPTFKKIQDALLSSIKRYFLRYQNEDNEFIRSFPKEIKFSSAWYVKMQSGGHLSSHIHEDGWISGAVYLAIPKDSGPSGQEGAIELSSDGDEYPRLHDKFEKKVILPNVGDVIFFPSSVFHRTIPFNSNEERICIAFDIKPKFR